MTGRARSFLEEKQRNNGLHTSWYKKCREVRGIFFNLITTLKTVMLAKAGIHAEQAAPYC
jgi:hypothetical protein